MSLGTTMPPPKSFRRAIREAAAQGILIVAAAGNDAGGVNYPACLPNVLAVSAIDRKGQIAPFSSHGFEVAFAAPGVGIHSAHLHNHYVLLSGTSQACPMIVGICALVLALHRASPELPSIRGLADMIKALAELTDGGLLAVRNSEFGYGIPHFTSAIW